MDAVSTALSEAGCSIRKRQGAHMIASLPWLEIDVQLCLKKEGLTRSCIITAHEVTVQGAKGEGVFRNRTKSLIASPDNFDEFSTAENVQEDRRASRVFSDPLEELAFTDDDLGTFASKIVNSVVSSSPLKAFSQPNKEDEVAVIRRSTDQGDGANDAEGGRGNTESRAPIDDGMKLSAPEKVKKKAWQYIGKAIEELDSRDLLFDSLKRCPFGAFPAQPAIDKQMVHLLKAAAREKVSNNKSASCQRLLLRCFAVAFSHRHI